MKCALCGSNDFTPSHFYSKPDRYEELVGLTEIERSWEYCRCGLFQQRRNYDLSELEKIYQKDYRDPEFRGETIQQSFDRIMAIENSENDDRAKWLTDRHTPRTLLDIGSGIGVFPYAMKEKGVSVWCTEENTYSVEFINSLGITCVKNIPPYMLSDAMGHYEMVSIVHVLEHIQDPVSFLKDLKKVLHGDGRLFVEVPDAEAFNGLNPDHDDFNSCHTHSYDVSTLYRMLRKAKFDVIDINRVSYPERKLKRIRGICKKLKLPKM